MTRIIVISALTLTFVGGTAVAKLPAPVAPQPSAQQTAISPQVTGRWIGGFENRANGEVSNSFLLNLKAEGGKLTGSMVDLSPMQYRATQGSVDIDDGRISGSSISFLLKGAPWNSQACAGEVKGDLLILTRQRSDGVYLPSFVLKRYSQ